MRTSRSGAGRCLGGFSYVMGVQRSEVVVEIGKNIGQNGDLAINNEDLMNGI